MGHEGEKDFFSKFGLEIRNQVSVLVSRRAFAFSIVPSNAFAWASSGRSLICSINFIPLIYFFYLKCAITILRKGMRKFLQRLKPLVSFSRNIMKSFFILLLFATCSFAINPPTTWTAGGFRDSLYDSALIAGGTIKATTGKGKFVLGIPDSAARSHFTDSSKVTHRADTAFHAHFADSSTNAHKADTSKVCHFADTSTNTHKADTAFHAYYSTRADTSRASHISDTSAKAHYSDSAYSSHKADTSFKSGWATYGDSSRASHFADSSKNAHKADTTWKAHYADTSYSSHRADTAFHAHFADSSTNAHKADTSKVCHFADTSTNTHKADTAFHAYYSTRADTSRASHISDTSRDAAKVGGLFAGGSGTQYYVPLWLSGGVTQGNSLIQQNSGGTLVGIGRTPTTNALEVAGNLEAGAFVSGLASSAFRFSSSSNGQTFFIYNDGNTSNALGLFSTAYYGAAIYNSATSATYYNLQCVSGVSNIKTGSGGHISFGTYADGSLFAGGPITFGGTTTYSYLATFGVGSYTLDLAAPSDLYAVQTIRFGL